jgi:hypothetical protein
MIQAAPGSIGLIGASGLILALTSDRTWQANATGRRLLGFCWRYLAKIGRQDRRERRQRRASWNERDSSVWGSAIDE